MNIKTAYFRNVQEQLENTGSFQRQDMDYIFEACSYEVFKSNKAGDCTIFPFSSFANPQ